MNLLQDDMMMGDMMGAGAMAVEPGAMGMADMTAMGEMTIEFDISK